MTSLCARRFRTPVSLFVLAASFIACDAGTPPKNELRLTTDDFVIRVAPENPPTRALEPIYWRVVVHEKETGKPVQGGQGRIFATNRDQKTTANGLEETGELGTYRTNIMFVTAGMWAMGLQFRRDSTQPLQRTVDWTQDILKANEPGDFSTPTTTRHDTLPSKPPTRRDSARPPGGN
jgi:hypothetical protein